MKEEKAYMELIERVIEQFGTIQRNFVLDRTGIRAIVKFIHDFSGAPPMFSLDDPVILKGKQAAFKVIEELAQLSKELGEQQPPAVWEKFHASLVESISLQLEGYREMTRVFDDSNMDHLVKGQELVNKGMGILEGGSRNN